MSTPLKQFLDRMEYARSFGQDSVDLPMSIAEYAEQVIRLTLDSIRNAANEKKSNLLAEELFLLIEEDL